MSAMSAFPRASKAALTEPSTQASRDVPNYSPPMRVLSREKKQKADDSDASSLASSTISEEKELARQEYAKRSTISSRLSKLIR